MIRVGENYFELVDERGNVTRAYCVGDAAYPVTRGHNNMMRKYIEITNAGDVHETPEQYAEALRVPAAAAGKRRSLNLFGPRNPPPPETDPTSPGRQPIYEDDPIADPIEAAGELVSRASNLIECYGDPDDSMEKHERLAAAADLLTQAAELHRPKKQKVAAGSQHFRFRR
jgi:hypothetical protein